MNFSSPRPIIFDYESVPRFVSDMLEWRRRVEPSFSVRTQLTHSPGCSPTLVTQVAKGTRSLTRDRVETFARLLGLTNQELKYLDQWVALDRRPELARSKPSERTRTTSLPPLQRPQNHLLSSWLNPYVKLAASLVGFKPDPAVIHRVLGGIAAIPQIAKSLEFLLREGFLRKTVDGRVVPNESLSTTTDSIPDKRIRSFHKQALDIAKRGIDLYPLHMRRSETMLLAVNEKNLEKLKQILMECMDQVEQFENDHRDDNERMYQVTLHLTPVGGGSEEVH